MLFIFHIFLGRPDLISPGFCTQQARVRTPNYSFSMSMGPRLANAGNECHVGAPLFFCPVEKFNPYTALPLALLAAGSSASGHRTHIGFFNCLESHTAWGS